MVKFLIVFSFFILDLYANNMYYTDKISQFEILSNKSKTIMMIGDSITDRGLWNELLDRNDIVNRGISGDTSIGLYNRINIYNIGLKKVFIMIGINDLLRGQSVDHVYKNYIQIVTYYKANRIIPVVQSTLYINDDVNSKINLKVKRLNRLLQKYCQSQKITFLDLNMVLSPEGYLNSKFTNDSIHLNGDGYKIWADNIKQYLD